METLKPSSIAVQKEHQLLWRLNNTMTFRVTSFYMKCFFPFFFQLAPSSLKVHCHAVDSCLNTERPFEVIGYYSR